MKRMDNNRSVSIISMTASCSPYRRVSHGPKCVGCSHWPVRCLKKPSVGFSVRFVDEISNLIILNRFYTFLLLRLFPSSGVAVMVLNIILPLCPVVLVHLTFFLAQFWTILYKTRNKGYGFKIQPIQKSNRCELLIVSRFNTQQSWKRLYLRFSQLFSIMLAQVTECRCLCVMQPQLNGGKDA